MCFLRQVTVEKAKRKRDGNWRSAAAARVIKEAVIQTLGTYIYKWQATVVDWVVLRPILDICNREMDYEGGGSAVRHVGGKRRLGSS